MHWILVRLWAEPVVANGNNSNGNAKAIGETAFMATTVEGEETGKVLVQINIGS